LGLTHDLTTMTPLSLSANFTPNYPLSLYLCGKARIGKSSLVRSLSLSLMDTIEHYLEPEILVRFVKQNLNKPYHVLELELDLRPNNNDMDVQLTKHTSTSATKHYILIHPVAPQVAIIQANQGDVALMHFLAKVPRKVQCFGL
jgi:hypothetical protein